jgi:two-component system, sensor histidine kinase and response regulator
MNLNSKLFQLNKLSPRFLVASLFLLLAISLEILMSVYWYYVLNPRLLVEAESNAKILAESQAKIISSELSSISQLLTQNDIDDLNDQVLVFIDPELKRPYFLGISLELDDEVLEIESASLDLSEGNLSCRHCFPVTTALYSPHSDELLGVANFMVSDVFYDKLKNDIKQILLLESLIGLVVLFIVWIAVNFLINKLNIEIVSRKKMAQQLHHAKENAEKASQTKSDFLANMSHEIRTPLNAIIGMAYILFRTPLNKRQENILTKLDSASHLLLNLINDLLDFSKIEAGKLELESTSFRMDEVLNNLSELINSKTAEKDLDILYHTSPHIPHSLIGDPMRLGQILLNLVNNALKFTEKGHILLVVDVAQAHQCSKNKTNTANNNIWLQFSISDTGIGIKKEDISKLFNSFTQADNSTTRKFGGTGLGLSICKQLIELMDGDIKVESNYGQGSTFSFCAKFLIDSEAEKASYILPAKIQHTHVLVIDDNQIAQSIFQKMLDCFGFRVSLASSAQQGIELLKQSSTLNPSADPIKLVLMDWKIPGMDGVEVTQIIKTQLDLQIIPAIILFTAHANIENSKTNETLWDDCLVKPVSQSILYDSIVSIFSEQPSEKSYLRGSTVIRKSAHTQLYDLSDKKVLLAEDNTTNQEVACALMEELKLQVSIANNGKEAVEVIQSTDFDLIFMDLQMPEMDGFEATSLIRANKQYQHIPIIAMTAHAMQGDRKKCLDAQMDDYITKPIDVDKFFAIINKWLVAEEDVIEVDIEIKSNSLFAHLKSIDVEKALIRVRGKEDLLSRLLINFKNQKFNIAENISTAVHNQELKLSKDLTHNLKGEAGTLEANRLFIAAKNLEQQILAEDTRKISEYLIEVTQALEEVLQEITGFEQDQKKQKQLATTNNQTSTTKQTEIHLNINTLGLQFEELRGLLEDNNLRAKIVAKTITPVLTQSLYAEQWELVLSALSVLNFEVALEHLKTLAITLKIKI